MGQPFQLGRYTLHAELAAGGMAAVYLARQTGAVYVGDEFSRPGDAEHYADSFHFTDAGAAAMARRVTAILFADARINELIKSEEEGSVRPVVYP